MKLSEFRKLIREEVRTVLNEKRRIRTTESFLNESLNDSEAYKIVVDLLKTLHSFTGKIEFDVENIYGYYNIVYYDPSGLTEDILTRMRNQRLSDSIFAPDIAEFGGDQIQMRFDEDVQDMLNIKDFDKKYWRPNKIK